MSPVIKQALRIMLAKCVPVLVAATVACLVILGFIMLWSVYPLLVTGTIFAVGLVILAVKLWLSALHAAKFKVERDRIAAVRRAREANQ